MRISEITVELDRQDVLAIEGNKVEKVRELTRDLKQQFPELAGVSHGSPNSFSNCESHPDFTRVFRLHFKTPVKLARIEEIQEFIRTHLLQPLQPAA